MKWMDAGSRLRLQAEADGLEGWEFVLEKPGEWLLLSAVWLPFSGLAVMNLFGAVLDNQEYSKVIKTFL